jgi:hypothetical protein
MRYNPIFGCVFFFCLIAGAYYSLSLFRTGIAKALYGVISLNTSLRTISSANGGVIPADFAAKFFSTQKARIDHLWCASCYCNEIIH